VIRDSYFVYACRTTSTFHFEIQQHHEHGKLRLQLTGELDLASAPLLENQLERLRADRQSVRLDLSRLGFMDSTGIHLLISAINQASRDGWQFEVDPELSPQVERLFELTGLKHITAGRGTTATEGLESVVGYR
jgi:anti-sigma B factor antagonist